MKTVSAARGINTNPSVPLGRIVSFCACTMHGNEYNRSVSDHIETVECFLQGKKQLVNLSPAAFLFSLFDSCIVYERGQVITGSTHIEDRQLLSRYANS